MSVSNLQKKLLAAAKLPPPRTMLSGGVIRDPELCSYCMAKYESNDDIFATPGCLLRQQRVPTLGGEFSRQIRSYLRKNRLGDSARKEGREDLAGLYQFPACCSCCKCPPCAQRIPGAASPQRRMMIDDMTGGDDDGELGDGFYDGGHVGYSANESDYIYMISNQQKGYPRALCLQQGVRYSFPMVGFVPHGDEGEEEEEEGVQPICLSWPTGNHPIEFLGTNCTVLQRTLRFIDAPSEMETVLLCNCRCPEGKAGLMVQDAMERVISYCSDGQSVTVNRIHFIQNINRMYGNNRLFRPQDLLLSLECLDCVHTRALKTMFINSAMMDVPVCVTLEKTAAKLESENTFAFNVKKVMQVEGEPAKDAEEDNDAYDYLHSCMVPRIILLGEGIYHAVDQFRNVTVFASESALLRFGSFIKLSARMVPFCTRCERDSCPCVYVGHLDASLLLGIRPLARDRAPKDVQFEELDVSDDNHMSPEGAIAYSYKLRSFPISPYSDEFPVISDPYRQNCHGLTDVLKPRTVCDCTRNVDAVGEHDEQPLSLHCRCCLHCSCDTRWDEEKCTPCIPLLVLHREFPKKYSVCGFRCPNDTCSTVLRYDGREDGITVLFCGQSGPHAGTCVAISTHWLLEIVKSLYDSYDPLTRLYDTMVFNYRSAGFDTTTDIIPKTTFFYHLQQLIPRLILPAFPKQAYECVTCGPSPKVVVYDGTENGIRRKSAPIGNFNVPEEMLDVPSIDNPYPLRPAVLGRRASPPPAVPVYYLKTTATWTELTTFAGAGSVKKQELLLRFCRAKPESAPLSSDELEAALLLFNGPTLIDRAVFFMLQYFTTHRLQEPIKNQGPLVQVISAKSVAPITGADGPLIVAVYSLLSMGIPGSYTLPALFTGLISPAKKSMMEATRIVRNIRRSPINEQNEAANEATINHFFEGIASDVPAWVTDDAKFAGEIGLKVLRLLLQKDLMCTVPNPTALTLIDVATTFFPQLGVFLCDLPLQVAPVWIRPLLACMGDKACNLWLRPTSYYMLPKNYLNYPHFKPMFTQPNNQMTLEEVIAASEQPGTPAFQLLTELYECEVRVPTTVMQNRQTGLVCVPSRSLRPMRKTWYLKDFINNNLANKAIRNGLETDAPAEEGELGICAKGTPMSSFFTPGIYTGQCACKRPCLLYLRYMDSYESPSYLMNAVFQTQDQPTPVLIYDAVRLLFLVTYCSINLSLHLFIFLLFAV